MSSKKSLKVKTLNEKLIKNLVMQINHVWTNLQHLELLCDVLFSTTLRAVTYKSLMTKAISWLSYFPNTPSTSMKVNLILIELLCSRLLFWWPRKDTYESQVVLHGSDSLYPPFIIWLWSAIIVHGSKNLLISASH